MKQIELELKKKLLIVEFEDLQHLENVISCHNTGIRLMSDKEEPTKLLCKGSELTEEIAKGLVKGMYPGCYITQTSVSQMYNSAIATYIDSALNAFKNQVKIKGYYWGENPIKKPDLFNYHIDEEGSLLYNKRLKSWKEAESKTFNPEKTIIFEIL